MAAGDSPKVPVREEEVKDARYMVQESAGFYREEVETAEAAAAAAEEALSRTAAAAVVPTWAERAVPL